MLYITFKVGLQLKVCSACLVAMVSLIGFLPGLSLSKYLFRVVQAQVVHVAQV